MTTRWRLALRRGACTLALVAPAALHAQWIPTRSFGVRNGLAQSQVMALAHDSHGYLWVATQGGVSRCNGLRFDTFTTADGLPDGYVTALAPAEEGRVWLGTDSGRIALWNGSGFSSWAGPGAPPAAVTGLLHLGSDGLLVGNEQGLWRWSPTGTERLLDESVTRLATPPTAMSPEDPWTWPVVLAGAVYRFDGAHVVPVLLPRLPGGEERYLSFAPTADGIWLGTNAGTVRFLSRSGTVRDTSLRGRSIDTLLASRDGGAWVAARDGLWRIHPDGRIVRQPLLPTDPAMEIRTLCEDREGNLWASPWSGGLYELTPDAFAVFNRASGFPTSQVWSLLEDEAGCMWMATEDVGVLRWCEHGITDHLLAGRELPAGRAMSLHGDGEGGIWIGTAGGVVHRDRAGALKLWTVRDGLPVNYARAVVRDRRGGIWAATSGGLARFDARRWQSWTKADGLPDANLRGLAFDRSGALWIATHSAGVVRFDGERFTTFGPQEGLPHPRVWCVMVDSRDRLWAGTDAGIWIHPVAGGQDRVIADGSALASLNVLSLVEDHDGLVWAGTTRGLSRIDPEGQVLHTLTADDGLAGSEANENASVIDRAGRLWVGTADGVTHLDPRNLPHNRVPPPPVLERLVVDGAVWSGPFPLAAAPGPAQPVVLGPTVTDLRFEFSALSFTAPERVRYRFMLEGYDSVLGAPTDERHCAYRHLPPGRYRFVLTACNNDGLWSEEALSLPLEVLSAWYQTWWFRVAAAAAVVAAVAGMFAANTAGQRRRRRRLEREVAVRTSELGEANRQIREQNLRLEDLSRTDPLTGLGNRRVLEDQLPLALALIRREIGRLGTGVNATYHGVGLFVIDLDRFKPVNDTWGHEVGDLVLKAVAEALRVALRDVDLAVRWGGDEIVVLGRAVDRSGIEILAGKLLDTIASTRVPLPDGCELALSASIGFVSHPLTAGQPLHGTHWADLVAAADRLLYLAKERGRGRACGVRWGPAGPPVGDGEQVLRQIQDDPSVPPSGLELVEIVRPV